VCLQSRCSRRCICLAVVPERRPDRVVLPPGAFCGCLRRPAAALLACFLFWPTLIEPVSSQPPPIPDWSGPFAANRRLSGIKILPEVGPGSESIAATRHGWLYTGLQDGRVGPEPRIGAKARSGGERSIHTLSMRSSLARTNNRSVWLKPMPPRASPSAIKNNRKCLRRLNWKC